jgi:hypothetical protein
MRRLLLVATAILLAASSAPRLAHAQIGPMGGGPDGGGPGAGGGGGGGDDQDEDAKKKKRDEEWGDKQAPLPALRNAGPCPFVKTLYDAARYIEFKGGEEASAAVGYTGEIQGVSAQCEYKSDDPIKVKMEILFELGRGPQAGGSSKTYRYWIAVTDRDREVITRQTFDLPVTFDPAHDRTYKTEEIQQIVIPRAKATVSGANFEILVGFEVTPEMAAFNRDGKRFRANAGATVAQAGAAKQQ